MSTELTCILHTALEPVKVRFTNIGDASSLEEIFLLIKKSEEFCDSVRRNLEQALDESGSTLTSAVCIRNHFLDESIFLEVLDFTRKDSLALVVTTLALIPVELLHT